MKKIISIVLLAVLSMSNSVAYSQESGSSSRVNLGIGMGIDYGGIVGGRLTVLPVKNFALFGAFGYNLLEAGVNAGGTYRFSPDKRVCPTLSAMYGYNGVIKITGAENYNKTYYGPSFSLGIEVKSVAKPKNHWNFELIVPIRPQQFKDDWDALKNNQAIEVKSEPLPIAISLGLHFGL